MIASNESLQINHLLSTAVMLDYMYCVMLLIFSIVAIDRKPADSYIDANSVGADLMNLSHSFFAGRCVGHFANDLYFL